MISEKLDILMKITDTRNCTLGQALSFDASYISRIRNGKRGIPKHMPFLEPAASYFSKKIKTDHQKNSFPKLFVTENLSLKAQKNWKIYYFFG